MYGDVRDLDRVCQAAAGMDIVVHLAAGLRGSSGFILESCIDGTKNVTEAARRGGLKRVIYMSSLSVYDYVQLRDGDVLTAHSPLEEYPEQRGAYSLGKRRAEDVALSHLQDPSPAWTILRPSLIMGKGADIFSPVGVKLGNVLFCLGAAHQHLRAVHVEDVGTAILQLLQHENTRGRVFPLSAPGTVTLQDYVETYIRAGRYQNLRVVYVPYWCAALGGWALETLRKRGIAWDEAALRAGFLAVRWPARIEVIGHSPIVVVDGAHNADSMQKLLLALRVSFSADRVLLVLSTTNDKDLVGIARALAGIDTVILTRMAHPRAATIEQLQSVFAIHAPNVRVYTTAGSSQAMDLALALANDNDLVCATGSLFMAAEVLRWSASRGNKLIASAIEGVDH